MYETTFVVPAGTDQSDPERETLEIHAGYIKGLAVVIPPGHARTAYLQIYYQAKQILPLTVGSAFSGDDTTINLPVDIPVTELPHSLELVGWNTDEDNQHEFHIYLYVETLYVQQVAVDSVISLPGR